MWISGYAPDRCKSVLHFLPGNPFIGTRYFALHHLNPSLFYQWVFQWSVRPLMSSLLTWRASSANTTLRISSMQCDPIVLHADSMMRACCACHSHEYAVRCIRLLSPRRYASGPSGRISTLWCSG